MTKEIKAGFNQDIAIPPGETLQEHLDSIVMSRVELAKRTGLTAKMINDIIKGKAPLTAETALKLESVFGTPASFWNNLESNYQETRARLQAAVDIDKETPIAALIPYPELARRGFVRPTNKLPEKVFHLRQFFGVASLRYIPATLPAAFKKPDKASSSPYALGAWIRMGELMAGDIETQSFNEKRLKENMVTFRALTMEEEGNFESELEDLCASCGIALVVVPHLPKTNARGVTKWLQPGKAMLQLSTRYKFADDFWFSFFHELGHILMHSKKAVFAETGAKTKEEAEADQFACDCMIPGAKYRTFITKNRFTRESIMKFANKVGIDPGVVAGRLHKDRKIGKNEFQDLQRKINLPM